MASYEDIKLWNKERLKSFLRDRGLPVAGNKDQLRSLVYGALYFNIPAKPSASVVNRTRAEEYQKLLTINGDVLPDPLSVLDAGWIGEKVGMSKWPPVMYGDLAEYLVNEGETELRKRLLSDYKEGKAFSYFDSSWLKEVFYHEISASSPYCFLKSLCSPSMNVNNEPHRVWVCVTKASGKIISGYCSCFAGLGSTCNHIAAVLFKLDYAWQSGFTNKACTSVPASWAAPSSKKTLEPKRLKDVEWRQPHYAKGGNKEAINPPKRQLFVPSESNTKPSLEGLLGSLYFSCKDSCVFEYAFPNHESTNYATHDTVNVESEETIETSLSVPPSLPDLAAHFGPGFHESLPILSKEEVAIVEQETRSQSSNPLWFQQRKGRITGSLGHSALAKYRKIMKGHSPGDLSNFLGFVMGENVINPNIRAIKYGREMEPIARKHYTDVMKQKGHKNINVKECGLCVSSDLQCMAASPDALVSCECCGSGLLEIKCPLKVSYTDPLKCPPDYLAKIGDQLSLKVSHQYHTQVVMQLAVTDYEWCDFFVYSKHGFFLQRIYKSEQQELIVELREAVRTVFDRFIVPKLLSDCETAESPLVSTSYPTVDAAPRISRGDEPGTSGIMSMGSTDNQGSVGEDFQPPAPKKAKRGGAYKRKKKTTVRPVYVCNICGDPCKEEENITQHLDNSIGCDLCYRWFHWGCVGYDGLDIDNWCCSACT